MRPSSLLPPLIRLALAGGIWLPLGAKAALVWAGVFAGLPTASRSAFEALWLAAALPALLGLGWLYWPLPRPLPPETLLEPVSVFRFRPEPEEAACV